MKLSVFQAPKLLTVALSAAQNLEVAYKPSFLTRAVADQYEAATAAVEKDTPVSTILERKQRYLSILLDDIGIEAEDGTKIEPTFENLRDVINIDLVTANKIVDAIHADMFVPLDKAGANSDSGSPVKEETTPTV